ncbi:transcriptional regulator [Phytohabitans suffuscus]|uniref:Transcriptional regulator n=2 Tax=Phytohabitans suffuscus TaxID=624315 RepID=A0A6F8YE73_9ACTN|nr:LuxR family transcriptional regulator [Phytohabitans suffuscus]BCB84360.1 transcriptional regulator [Phytohabitans suffuscus]
MLVERDRDLVERDRESAQLASSLSECLTGKGGVVTISGPVGSGKTALLRAFARRAAESGFVHLSAKASRTERGAAMGVMGQLFGGARLSDDATDKVMRLLDDAALTAMLRDRDDDSAEQVDVQVRRGLGGVLLELAERAPLLISVDDAHFADAESMQCLLYLIRRIDSARVLVVLTGTAGMRPPWPRLVAELLSQPNCRRMRLNLLSPEGVASLLADRIDAGDMEPEFWHRLSGGSPLLLSALVEDYRALHGEPPCPEGVAGEAFTQAVQTCLYRGDESMLPVARALAVLGEPASPALLSELLGDACPSAPAGLEAATEAGIVDDGRFRHPRSAVAVLDAMSTHDRTELHDRVAHVLYRNGAAAVTVARHALATRRTEAPWSVTVLREAAEQAMEQDDTGMALDCLRLAERSRVDVGERAGIHAALLRAKWRLDPVSAERYARELVPVARSGRLRPELALMLVKHLMWFGRPAEAAEVLDTIPTGDGPDTALAVSCVRARFGYFYPGSASDRAATAPVPRASTLPGVAGRLRVRTANIVDAVHREGVTEEAVTDALAILQQYRLDDHSWESIVISLETLVLAECLDKAAARCDELLREAEDRRVPTWRALLSAIRATISLRQGNLPEAERYAQAALSLIRPKGLGVFIGGAISVLLLAATRRGHFDEALRLLAMPVPDAMFQTPFGLCYLRARGRFQLARGSHKAAIEDFETCGELMARWGLDLPGLAPWRTDLAEARRGLGVVARHLAAEQLAKLGAYNRRTKGISLRELAATAELKQRALLLREAVEELQAGGDQLELVEALAELGEAQQALGEYAKARITTRRAQQLATRYELEDLIAARPAPDDDEADPPDDPVIEELSDAERRVAALAAQGHTNQQIARKLFITVSTVEQHLTRVYRKLRINRRSDLPFSLVAGLRNTA